MNYLLDTNLVSERMKPRPNAGVIDWLDRVDEDSTFLSVVTLMELRYGIERSDPGQRRRQLEAWLKADLPVRFEGRIVPVDLAIADSCGRVVARGEALGRPIETRDAFIAATAEVYGLTLVTRDTSDFEPVLKSILSPWT